MVAPGKVGADNLRNDRVEMLDKLLGRGFIAFFPTPQTVGDVNRFVHFVLILAIARTASDKFDEFVQSHTRIMCRGI